MNTPIKYFGGKGTMFNSIIKEFPPLDSIETYIEPFGGSYSIGLKLDAFPMEIYNDLDRNVFCLYKVLSNPHMFEQFKVLCDLALYSEEVREQFREELKKDNLSWVHRAFYFFYVNRTSHNGVGGFSLNTVVRRNMSKSVSDFLSAIDRLPELHQRLSKVAVLHRDGVELIQKFDREKVFMYLDPPYEQSTRTSARYKVDMNRETQERLLDTLLNLKHARFLLSGYDCELYSRLDTENITKIQFEVKTVDGKRNPKTKVETLWKNY